MPIASIVRRKGPWPYVVSLLTGFVSDCSREGDVILRGDGEYALQAL